MRLAQQRLHAAPAPPLTFTGVPSSAVALQPLLPPAAAAAAAPSAPRSTRTPALRSLVPAVAYQTKEKEPLMDTLKRAGKRALGGGVPGAAAMGVQVRVVGGAALSWPGRSGMSGTECAAAAAAAAWGRLQPCPPACQPPPLWRPNPCRPPCPPAPPAGAVADVAAHDRQLSVSLRHYYRRGAAPPVQGRRRRALLPRPGPCAAAGPAVALWRHRRQRGCARGRGAGGGRVWPRRRRRPRLTCHPVLSPPHAQACWRCWRV